MKYMIVSVEKCILTSRIKQEKRKGCINIFDKLDIYVLWLSCTWLKYSQPTNNLLGVSLIVDIICSENEIKQKTKDKGSGLYWYLNTYSADFHNHHPIIRS